MDYSIIHKFKITDSFFGRYEQLVCDSVIPYQEKALRDEIEGADKSHCIENFRMAAEKLKTGKTEGEFYGMVFQDSDVAKWLEGAAYSLLYKPDKELEGRCDEVIELLGSAQHEDGYLNTYFTIKEPDKRWSNLCEAHELYCAGHLIEAACAYFECTGKSRFLDIMKKYADCIYTHFITEGAEGWSGHPEIELALMRLYRCTGEERYYELAKHFIDVRGTDPQFYVKEREKCGWTVWGNNPHDTRYSQCNAPVRELSVASGHAVRAVYLYTAMADLAAKDKDAELLSACKRLWNSITRNRMYITGGIGSAYEGEAFTVDYHLPNDTAYAETCAAIGLIFFANKMLKADRSSEYANVMERALYNCVLAGMELDGKKFFYVNPLEIVPGISGTAQSMPHVRPIRPKWFTCACCPPNVARLLPSIAEYAWHTEENTVYSNLFIAGTLDLSDTFGGKISLESDFPYNGGLKYKAEGNFSGTLSVRIPDYAEKLVITKNGKAAEYEIKNGYAYINSIVGGDIIEVDFSIHPRFVYANSKVSADSGKAAVQYGALVYCAEGADNGEVLNLAIDDSAEIRVGEYEPNTLFGIRRLYAKGERITTSDSLYSYEKPTAKPCEITLIPYYAHSNRGENQMRVWNVIK